MAAIEYLIPNFTGFAGWFFWLSLLIVGLTIALNVLAGSAVPKNIRQWTWLVSIIAVGVWFIISFIADIFSNEKTTVIAVAVLVIGVVAALLFIPKR